MKSASLAVTVLCNAGAMLLDSCANVGLVAQDIVEQRKEIAAAHEQLAAVIEEIKDADSASANAETAYTAAIETATRAREIASAVQAELGCQH